jgi:hypothetical protein
MNLEAVTTCVQCADFLAATLPLNRPQFDRYVVVTSPEDSATQQVCDFWDVEVVKTDAFGSRWGEWRKALGINAGLQQLGIGAGAIYTPKSPGWILHLDADIALPPRARTMLDRADLDRTVLYGADRLRVPSYEAWQDHLSMPHVQTDGYHVRMDPRFEVMPRFNAWHINGYAPPGYFQLWHPQASGIKEYPGDHNGGDKTDVLFTQQWPRAKRSLLGEFAVYHLDSGINVQGANWGGRVTERFGPQPSREPNDYPHRHHHHHKHHRHHYGDDDKT